MSSEIKPRLKERETRHKSMVEFHREEALFAYCPMKQFGITCSRIASSSSGIPDRESPPPKGEAPHGYAWGDPELVERSLLAMALILSLTLCGTWASKYTLDSLSTLLVTLPSV